MAQPATFPATDHRDVRTDRAEERSGPRGRSHLALLEDGFRNQGLTPDEARLAARRAFGGVEQAKEAPS